MKIEFHKTHSAAYIDGEYFAFEYLKKVYSGWQVVLDNTSAKRQKEKAEYFFEKYPEYLL